MTTSNSVTISNVSPKGQITVPADIRRELGIEPGGKVRFVRKGKRVLIEAYTVEPLSSLFGIVKPAPGVGFADLDGAIEAAWDARADEFGNKRRK